MMDGEVEGPARLVADAPAGASDTAKTPTGSPTPMIRSCPPQRRRDSSPRVNKRRAQNDFVAGPSAGPHAHLNSSGQQDVSLAEASEPRQFLGPINLAYLASLIRAAPWVLLVPVAVFCICCGLGVFGVLAASSSSAQAERDTAHELALDAARQMELQMLQVFSPVIALEIQIQLTPYFPDLVKRFDWMSARLMARLVPGTLTSIQLAPNLVTQAIYPLAANRAALGHDLLADPTRAEDTLRAVASRNLTVSGPYRLLQGGYGVVVRFPVFVVREGAEDETWGANRSSVACPPGLCWQPETNSRLWGFAQGLARLDGIIEGTDARMQRLEQYGPWALTRAFDNGTETVLASNLLRNRTASTLAAPGSSFSSSSSASIPEHSVAVDVVLPNALWRLYLARHDGWVPAWKAGMLALVVGGSFMVAVLLFCLLGSNQRHRALLHAMFPDKVVRQLQQGQNFSEEFANITILFSDIVSYTTISSELRPMEVAEMLNELYHHFDGLVDKHSVYKIETIGDAFMVVGGCPHEEAHEAAALRVALMALDMVRVAAVFRSSRGHQLRIRVGLHSGPAAAAVIGRKMPRYCLFGDTVNLASRMETNSEPMRIHVSSATAALLRCAPPEYGLELRCRGLVPIKGKGPMETYWLQQHRHAGALEKIPSSSLTTPTAGIAARLPALLALARCCPGSGNGSGGASSVAAAAAGSDGAGAKGAAAATAPSPGRAGVTGAARDSAVEAAAAVRLDSAKPAALLEEGFTQVAAGRCSGSILASRPVSDVVPPGAAAAGSCRRPAALAAGLGEAGGAGAAGGGLALCSPLGASDQGTSRPPLSTARCAPAVPTHDRGAYGAASVGPCSGTGGSSPHYGPPFRALTALGATAGGGGLVRTSPLRSEGPLGAVCSGPHSRVSRMSPSGCTSILSTSGAGAQAVHAGERTASAGMVQWVSAHLFKYDSGSVSVYGRASSFTSGGADGSQHAQVGAVHGGHGSLSSRPPPNAAHPHAQMPAGTAAHTTGGGAGSRDAARPSQQPPTTEERQLLALLAPSLLAERRGSADAGSSACAGHSGCTDTAGVPSSSLPLSLPLPPAAQPLAVSFAAFMQANTGGDRLSTARAGELSAEGTATNASAAAAAPAPMHAPFVIPPVPELEVTVGKRVCASSGASSP